MSGISYRPDIDALRGLAVFLVVIFHAFPEVIPGGFIGVDVFFVISGYLITTIILTSIEKNSFSIIEFYSRRVKRLFPALIVVLLTVLLTGWLVLFPDEFKQLGDHIAHSAIYILNYILIGEVGYTYDDLDGGFKYDLSSHVYIANKGAPSVNIDIELNNLSNPNCHKQLYPPRASFSFE